MSLSSSLEELKVSSKFEEEERVFNDALSKFKEETSLKNKIIFFKTILVCLIKQDKYKEGLKFIEKYKNESFAKEIDLEKAYIYYQVGDCEKAMNIAGKYVESSSDEEDSINEKNYNKKRALCHIFAQCQYRKGDYNGARLTYEYLNLEIKKSGAVIDNEIYDTSVNYLAAISMDLINFGNLNLSDDIDDIDDTYEKVFNKSFIYLKKKQYTQSLDLLMKSKSLCQNATYLTQDEKEIEINSIILQASYINYLIGNISEFQLLTKQLTEKNKSQLEESLGLIISNNEILSSLKYSNLIENPYLLLRQLDTYGDSNDNLKSNNTIIQKKDISFNRLVVQSLIGNEINIKKKIKSHLSIFPADVSVELLLLHFKQNEFKSQDKNNIIKILKKEFKKSPENISFAFIIGQLYVEINNQKAAFEVIYSCWKRLQDNNKKYLPGIVGVLANFYNSFGDYSNATKILVDAALYWIDSNKAAQFSSLICNAALSILYTKRFVLSEDKASSQLALKLFNILLSINKNDLIAKAGLTACLSILDFKKSNDLIDGISYPDSIFSTINVDKLESNGVYTSITSIKRTANIAGLDANSRKTKRSKEKNQKSQNTTKTQDNGNDNQSSNSKVDPERWIPLKDRSYYKPKRKSKKQAKASTQGNSGDVREEFDLSHKTTGPKQNSSNQASKKKRKGK